MTDQAKHRGRGRGCLGFLAAMVLLGIVAGIGFTLWRRTQEDDIRARFAARGLPTSLQELDEWYEHVPDEENAALGFLAAADAIVAPAIDEEENDLPIIGKGEKPRYGLILDDETARVARDYLDKNADALERARAAAQRARARYPINLTLGVAGSSAQMPGLAKLRSLARLLCLEALVRTHDGDTSGAVEAFEANYAAAQSFANEPLLVSQLVGIAIEGLGAEHICNALSARPFRVADLNRIAGFTAKGNPRESFYRAIAGEAAFGLFDPSRMNPMSSPMFTLDRRAYARDVEAFLDTATLSTRAAVSEVQAMTVARPNALLQRLHPFSSILMPMLLRSLDAAVRAEVYRDLLQLVVAIEKYRFDNDALPDHLSELVPEYLDQLPQDPYSDGPYLYLREQPGYVVYSIGVDRADGHGEKVTGTGGDINLRVTR